MSKNKVISFKNSTLALVFMMAAASMTGCKDYEEKETCNDQDVHELYEKLKNQDPRHYVDKEQVKNLFLDTIKSTNNLSRYGLLLSN